MESLNGRNHKTLISIILVLLIIVIALSAILLTVLLKPPSGVVPDSGLSKELDSETRYPTSVPAQSTSTRQAESLPSITVSPTIQKKLTLFGSLETPTATLTQIPAYQTQINVKLVIEENLKGDYLTVTGGDQNYNYRLGPLAKGSYAVGPNGKFLVYLTNDGFVYAARVGNLTFVRINNLRRKFSATNKNIKPGFKLSFIQTEYAYYLVIVEEIYKQQISLILPREITH